MDRVSKEGLSKKMSIREFLDCNGSYSAINREERNLAAILFHALLLVRTT